MPGSADRGGGVAGRRRPRGRPALRRALDRLYRDFDRIDAAADPVHLVRRYPDAADREIAGFLAAGLAFGRVASVLSSITRVLAPMGPSPASFVRRFDPARDAARFRNLGHRWTTGVDLSALLWTLRQILDTAGSVEAFFAAGLDRRDETVAGALDAFGTRARALDVRAVYGAEGGRVGVWYFYPKPSDGSACKRLNLFLRWMVRRDTIDLGVWTRVSPAQLIVPLDTHVIRLAQCLRLTRVRTPGWRMAAEITASLRALDADDPVRYDFALCHLGMMNACGFGTARGDRRCPLAGLCRPRGSH